MLKIPTIADRAWQCLAKFALEPAHEATFHERSYGFRPGRSACVLLRKSYFQTYVLKVMESIKEL